MKTTLLFLSVFLTTSLFGQYTQIPDPNFEQALINAGYDNTIDGQVITQIINNISNLNVSGSGISSIEGIEDFINLIELNCSDNSLTYIGNLNPGILRLDCSQNQINGIDLDELNLLEHLNCSSNNLSTINLNANNLLEDLNCSSNNLSTINLNANNLLEDLNCSNNNLLDLDLSQNIDIKYLICENNAFSAIDLSTNILITYLSVGGPNFIYNYEDIAFLPDLGYLSLNNIPNTLNLNLNFTNEFFQLFIKNCGNIILENSILGDVSINNVGDVNLNNNYVRGISIDKMNGNCDISDITFDVDGFGSIGGLNIDSSQTSSVLISNVQKFSIQNSANLISVNISGVVDTMVVKNNPSLVCLSISTNGEIFDHYKRIEIINNNLDCLEVDEAEIAEILWSGGGVWPFSFSPEIYFSENCNNDCSNTSSLTELNSNKNLIQILDLMGRETSFKPNTPLIYVYDDGSIEKVFSVEY